MGGSSGLSSQNTAQNQNTSLNQTTAQNQSEATNQATNQSGTGITSQLGSSGPWEQSMPFLSGILGQLQGQMGSTGVTGAENTAYNSIANNAAGVNAQFTPQVSGVASNLLAGGGAQATDPMLNQAYQDYQRRLSPTANGSMIGANSGLQPYLNTLSSDITNQVNGSFAGAGRDFSGANQQALGRGIAQGLSPVIASQYNTDTANMLGAAGNLYGAGNTTAGALAGNNAQANANRTTGAGLIPQIGEMQNAAPNAVLQAEAARRGIPLQTLGLLANIGVPIAGLGQTTSSTGTTSQNQQGTMNGTGTMNSTGSMNGTSTMNGSTNTQNRASPVQQFGQIASGIGSLFGGSNPAAGNLGRFFFS